MIITLQRIYENSHTTIGLIYMPQGDVFTCLEDRRVKTDNITGQARIPKGCYEIKQRNFGRFYNAYKKRYGHDHVFEISNIPDFTDVLFHTGNSHRDTQGCVLIGYSVDLQQMIIGKSRQAYGHFYTCLNHLFHQQDAGEKLYIHII